MSHFDRSLRSQFFLTGPRPCPYLAGRWEQKLFTNLAGSSAAALHDELAAHGFRRSQNIAYRPACSGCDACVSTRVRARDFEPTRTQRRVLKRNEDLTRRVLEPWASEEQYALFRRYLALRHADGGMTDMDAFDFAAMVEDSAVRTRIIEYRAPQDACDDPAPEQNADKAAEEDRWLADAGERSHGRLVAACLTDLLSDGLSLVYSFFDPKLTNRSLGNFLIMDHVDLAATSGLDYVYLGYWVSGSKKMDYKRKFRPSEILTDRGWITAEDFKE